MSGYQWALLLHLAGVVAFFAGMAVAAVAYEAARRRDDAREIALLLRLTRPGVALVGAGTLALLAGAGWLLAESRWSLGDGWVSASLALFVAAAVLGSIAGRRPRAARLRAEAGDAEGSRTLLDDRASRALNYASGALAVLVLVLMVWKPGA